MKNTYRFTTLVSSPSPKKGFYGEIDILQEKGWEVLNFTDNGKKYPHTVTICYLRRKRK